MSKLIIPLILAVLAIAAAAFFFLADDGAGPDDSPPPVVDQPEPEIPMVGEAPPTPPMPSPPGNLPSPDLKALAETRPDKLVSGTIYGGDGRPMGGATVEVYRVLSERQRATGIIRQRFREEHLGQVASGEDGGYQFDFLADLEGNFFTMRVKADGHVPTIKDHIGPGMVIDAHLEPGGRVTGTITDQDTGEPVGGVRVEIGQQRPSDSMHRYMRYRETLFTDANGQFVAQAAPVGHVTMILDHPEYERTFFGTDEKLTVEGGVENRWDLPLKRGLILEGVVVDETSGRPVKTAEVGLYDMLFFAPSQREKTGVLGKFRMEGVRRKNGARIEIRARGYGDHFEQISLTEDDLKKPLRFVLKPAGTAGGRVVDAAGDPVVGAKIYVAKRVAGFRQIRNDSETVTDGQGRFLVSDIHDGAFYTIAASAPGLTLGSSEDFSGVSNEIVEGMVITLERGATIQGRVMDETGVGVEGAVVSLEQPPYETIWFPPTLELGMSRVLTVVTDETGFYRLEGLYPGYYHVTPDHPDYIPVERKRTRVAAGNETLKHDFELQVGHRISGNVVDHFGNPAVGAKVIAILNRGQASRATTEVDAEGRYRLTRLLDRPHRVWVESDRGAAPAVDDVPADSAGANFVIEEYGRITATVLAQSSDPVSRFKVRLSPLMDVGRSSPGEPLDLTDREVLKLVRTHEAFREVDVVTRDGKTELDRISPGEYALEIISPNHRQFSRTGINVLPGTATDLGTLIVAEGARFEGVVRDTQGNPLKPGDLQVSVTATPGSLRKTVIDETGKKRTVRAGSAWEGKQAGLDADGVFSVGGLPPGPVRVVFQSPTFCVPEPRVHEFGASGITRQDLDLVRAARVTLRVVDEKGDPIPMPTCDVNTLDGRPAKVDGRRIIGRGETNGTLRVEKLQPGTYLLMIKRYNFERVEMEVSVAEGEHFQGEAELHSLR